MLNHNFKFYSLNRYKSPKNFRKHRKSRLSKILLKNREKSSPQSSTTKIAKHLIHKLNTRTYQNHKINPKTVITNRSRDNQEENSNRKSKKGVCVGRKARNKQDRFSHHYMGESFAFVVIWLFLEGFEWKRLKCVWICENAENWSHEEFEKCLKLRRFDWSKFCNYCFNLYMNVWTWILEIEVK